MEIRDSSLIKIETRHEIRIRIFGEKKKSLFPLTFDFEKPM
ncbi:hypothetical protein LEP1GSC052_0938 [Leptospira kmetyi serovar Malaysia str. Bejo-Iso9]|nr:hypothetical protein LEP1GSC052_0938 [Leptospira kmetyi serovar Malaysia str. Bejo-Iso9]